MKFVKPILTFLIIGTAVIGDFVVFKSKYSESHAFRAFSDTTVHATIGFLSALIFFTHNIEINGRDWIYNVIICTLISSLIDIDHVFVARSFYIKDLTNLKQRGIFHCTTFWLLITTALLLYSYITKKLNIYESSFTLILAYTSHHVRDGNRRGLWMFPFGHTPAISKPLYIMSIALVPHLLAYIFIYFKTAIVKGTADNYVMVV